jgi:uncharacterized circularly permuted ATP-grasp superfamily protein
MAIQHVNRRGDTWYLHEGRTKTGKPKYFFSRKQEGTLAATIPAGYEVYENPQAQVFLRKTLPQIITAEEVRTVEQALQERAKLEYYLIDVKGPSIVVHLPNTSVDFLEHLAGDSFSWRPAGLRRAMQTCLNYSPMMQFTLVNQETRGFSVERWCFRGAIDDWIPLAYGDLRTLVAKYGPHLGKESFYDLI